jgi:hypothetical protein
MPGAPAPPRLSFPVLALGLNDPADADVEEGEILVAAGGEVEEVEILDDAAIASAMEVDAESAACFNISESRLEGGE